MLLTEEEAKTKVCHKTMAAFNEVNGPGPWKCIASDCMAWCVAYDDWSENAATKEKTFHLRGYCGLAGKP